LVNITLTNKNLHAKDSVVTININTGICTFADKRKTPLKMLLNDADFSHPLLTRTPIPAANFHYEYDDIDGLFYSSIYVYSTLLNVDKPQACQFKINPSKKFQSLKFAEQIYFSIHEQKRAEETITIHQLNELVSHLSGFLFKFSEDFMIADTFTINELPSNIDGDALYKRDEKIIELLKNPNDFSKFELRYVNPIMGFGVFSRSTLQKDDIVAVYNGVKTAHEPSSLEYTFQIKDDCFNMYLDARQHGNITRFINHAPSPGKSKTNHQKPTLLEANVISASHFISGIEVVIYSATKEILPGEQLLVNYGTAYFNDTNIGRFNAVGRMISSKRFIPKQTRKKLIHMRIMANHGVEKAQIYLSLRTLFIFIFIVMVMGVLKYL